MKARIIKHASGCYGVERLDGDSWRYVRESVALTLEQAEMNLRLFIEVGEPAEHVVIREVEY